MKKKFKADEAHDLPCQGFYYGLKLGLSLFRPFKQSYLYHCSVLIWKLRLKLHAFEINLRNKSFEVKLR